MIAKFAERAAMYVLKMSRCNNSKNANDLTCYRYLGKRWGFSRIVAKLFQLLRDVILRRAEKRVHYRPRPLDLIYMSVWRTSAERC